MKFITNPDRQWYNYAIRLNKFTSNAFFSRIYRIRPNHRTYSYKRTLKQFSRGGSNEDPQSMFWAKIWKIPELFTSENFQFLEVKLSVYLNRHVFLMSIRPNKLLQHLQGRIPPYKHMSIFFHVQEILLGLKGYVKFTCVFWFFRL